MNLLTMNEAQMLLKVSRPTMRKYLEGRYVEGFKLPGGQWRISKESIARRLQEEENGNLNPRLAARAEQLGRLARDMAGS